MARFGQPGRRAMGWETPRPASTAHPPSLSPAGKLNLRGCQSSQGGPSSQGCTASSLLLVPLMLGSFFFDTAMRYPHRTSSGEALKPAHATIPPPLLKANPARLRRRRKRSRRSRVRRPRCSGEKVAGHRAGRQPRLPRRRGRSGGGRATSGATTRSSTKTRIHV